MTRRESGRPPPGDGRGSRRTPNPDESRQHPEPQPPAKAATRTVPRPADSARYVRRAFRRGWWLHRHTRPAAEPSDYGLSEPELRAEACRCRAAGWQPWEIAERLARPGGGT